MRMTAQNMATITQAEQWITQDKARIAEIRESLKDDTLTADEREALLAEEGELEDGLEAHGEHLADRYHEQVHNHWD